MSYAASELRRPLGTDERHISAFAQDVVAGLSAPRKYLQAKHFYDARGSELFEMICVLDEYYPTRTEMALLKQIMPALALRLPTPATLVEFGSGASEKTRLLLEAIELEAYIPIDISAAALDGAMRALNRDYPNLIVQPLHADFTAPIQLPRYKSERVGFFPGSTIGNFTHAEAVRFMRNARTLLGKDSHFILGADLIKDQDTLVRAYDDAEGVTAAFNLNLLVRINRELEGDVDLRAFSHRAVWNDEHARIEMHLVSQADQSFKAAGRRFSFRAGETIHTENCHKFSRESIAGIAQASGWHVEQFWQSDAPAFAIILLKAA